ncbi:hypothetical protein RDI58_000807 [Solanum bulbocastanum]|uniref:Uncharacterized protein n=1 Tax=Solanum bulbocastanum TaxID=147425 RepID=A0AAN8YMM2_SOLBU
MVDKNIENEIGLNFAWLSVEMEMDGQLPGTIFFRMKEHCHASFPEAVEESLPVAGDIHAKNSLPFHALNNRLWSDLFPTMVS